LPKVSERASRRGRREGKEGTRERNGDEEEDRR